MAAAYLAASACYADSECDAALTRQYRNCARIVDSLRPDKAGQARVFALDGSEFTAGQALWMRGQLRRVDRACAHGDQAEAERVLAELSEVIKAHQRLS
jgi:hypothetical protein